MSALTRGFTTTTLRLLAVLTVPVLALVPVAAYADPLDPTWLGGFWDDDDFDCVILLVTDGTASLPAITPELQPTMPAVGIVPVHVADAPSLERRPPFRRRGPPIVSPLTSLTRWSRPKAAR